MNLHAVGRLLGVTLLLLSGFLLIPGFVGLLYQDTKGFFAFLVSAAVTAVAGGALALVNKGSAVTPEGRPDYFRREGLAVVGLSWLVCGVAGALPFLIVGTFDSFIDAYFESVSGLTTTGSTVLSGEGIDSMPPSIAFWRSFSHWLGGFGIVMVFVVLFPTGGRSLFRSEIPGIAREAGHQRVRDSALALMRIYVGISLAEFVLLYFAGMSSFDAALHTFGTIATGGFSNHSESIGFYQSVPIELIITMFMWICGFNFAIYDTLLRVGPRPAWRSLVSSTEARAYVGITLGATLLIGGVLWFWGGSNGLGGIVSNADSPYPKLADLDGKRVAALEGSLSLTHLEKKARNAGFAFDAVVFQDEDAALDALETLAVDAFTADAQRLSAIVAGNPGLLLAGEDLPDYRRIWGAMRASVFQVVCLQTSTGYGTADFDRWPGVCRVLLMLLAAVGACAGSTGGGIKVVRCLIVARAALVGVRRFVRPRAIHAVRMDGQTLDEGIVASVTSYFALWMLVFLGGTLFLSFCKIDLVSSGTAVLATLNNIGPGLKIVGPTLNFAEIPDPGKLMLTIFMILGRLEFYAVVALFVPGFWRR